VFLLGRKPRESYRLPFQKPDTWLSINVHTAVFLRNGARRKNYNQKLYTLKHNLGVIICLLLFAELGKRVSKLCPKLHVPPPPSDINQNVPFASSSLEIQSPFQYLQDLAESGLKAYTKSPRRNEWGNPGKSINTLYFENEAQGYPKP
jgi:hypothetical protein